MTEEEPKAEEYLLSQEGVCVGGCEYSYQHNNAIKKAFLAGLAEGRKEAKEYIRYLKRQRQGGIQKQYNKIAKIKELEKENKLKKEIIIGEQQEINRLEAQIEKMKCCGNCKNHYFHYGHELVCRLENECELDEHGDYKYDKWEIKV